MKYILAVIVSTILYATPAFASESKQVLNTVTLTVVSPEGTDTYLGLLWTPETTVLSAM